MQEIVLEGKIVYEIYVSLKKRPFAA